MTLVEIHEFLRQNGYVQEIGSKLVLTGKYSRDLVTPPVSSTVPAVQVKPEAVNSTAPEALNAKDMFKKFIKLAEVPTKIYRNDGSFYWADRYSVPADRAFAKIIKKGEVNMAALILCTKLYYKSNGSRETISNYFTRGTWESCYEEFMTQHGKGTLETHVNKTLKEGNGENKYEQGI